MKKITLFLLSLISFQIQAQQILNIYSVPANPTTADSVYILADCQFNSGGCAVWQQAHNFSSTFIIDAFGFHCLGPLSFICNYTDTFSLGILAAGNYTFNFQLDEGFGGPPCTPGIAPGPSDSYNFTVSFATSAEEIDENLFTTYPNPAAGELVIRSSKFGDKIEMAEIYNAFGEKIFSQKPLADSQGQIVINVSALTSGTYFVQLKSENKSFGKMFSVQR